MSASPRGALVALASALAAVALVGVVRNTRALSAAEHVVARTAVEAAGWRTTPHPLGRFTARRGDVMRVTACPTVDGDPGLRLVARGPAGRPLVDRALTAAASDARRCVGLRWTVPAAASFEVELVRNGDAPSTLRRLTLHLGPELRARDVWPLGALLLALAALVLAPSVTRDPPRAEPEPEASLFVPVADRPAAIVALFATLIGCSTVLPVLVLRSMAPSPVTTLAALAAQNLGFCLAAAWMLGGLDRDGPPLREALALHRVPPRWLLAAAPLAAALLALAMATNLWITDTSESPIAQELASTPTRLVLLFTALIAPLSEELFYRVAAMRVLRRAGAAGAVVLQAMVFTAMHALQLRGALWGLLPIASVALANGWLRRASGGAGAPWLVHTLYNGVLIGTALRGVS